jgi:hypothetical protein
MCPGVLGYFERQIRTWIETSHPQSRINVSNTIDSVESQSNFRVRVHSETLYTSVTRIHCETQSETLCIGIKSITIGGIYFFLNPIISHTTFGVKCPYFVCWQVCLRGTPPSGIVLHHREIQIHAEMFAICMFYCESDFLKYTSLV